MVLMFRAGVMVMVRAEVTLQCKLGSWYRSQALELLLCLGVGRL